MSSESTTRWPRRLARCVNLDDLRGLAARSVPYPIFDHIDGGSDDEVTPSRNRGAFDRYALVPRLCTGVEAVDATTSVLGQPLEWPWFAGPAGGLKYLHRDGEIGAARAAHQLGTAYAMSGWTNTAPEAIAAAAPQGTSFFQLQPARSRELMEDGIERAASLGFDALIITVDNPIHGNRERDARSGFGVPARFTAHAWASILSHPRWCLNVIPMPGFGLYDDYLKQHGHDLTWLANQLVTNITWDEIRWVRERWSGPLAIKGIMAVDDLRRAVACGVDAVVLSNQGGRHFDNSPATLDMLPDAVAAIGDQAEIILDGGIRRGTDILKALALGATACSGARPYCYGLAAAGQIGAERAMTLLRAEVERTMVFLGTNTLQDLHPGHIRELEALPRGLLDDTALQQTGDAVQPYIATGAG